MNLLNVVRKGVATADKVTKSLQALVTFEQYLSDDGFGTAIYAYPRKLRAIVDWKQKQVRTAEGELTVTRATVTLLNIAEVVAATGGDGIDDKDRFTLPDGTTGPILDMGGFIDAGTGHPVATEVFIG